MSKKSQENKQENILIVGAKSDIAKAIATAYAKNNSNLILAGRKIEELKDFSSDLEIRYGIKSQLAELDLADFDSHQSFYNSLENKPNGVVLVAGYMAEQKECQADWSKTLNTINVNYTGAVSLLNIVANEFEKLKSGFIVGISSVAGDRGRRSNYIYGSSKAGFSAYLSGLRSRMSVCGVKVLTVKPGFVDTKMTAHLDLPAKLTAKPEQVAQAVLKAVKKGRNVVYVKPIWWCVMLIIKHIPEGIFKRLNV
jgi:short-subunit dehydrogenase